MLTRNIFSIAFVFCSLYAMPQDVKKIKITDLEKTIAESKEPLVVNFWATFCLPCIEEIPYFEKMTSRYKSDKVTLLLVSLDLKDDYKKIKPFAINRKFSAPIVWLDESNADYFMPRVDSSWSGSIPATLFINNKTGYRQFSEKEFSEADLEAAFRLLIGKD